MGGHDGAVPAAPVPPDTALRALVQLSIAGRADVERARRACRALARAGAFAPADAEAAVLATVELATNLLRHARRGSLTLALLAGPRGIGLHVVSRDTGPGIADLHLALQDGYSTGGGLGGGLPGVRRLRDDFDIATSSEGTCIVTRKWRKTR
jgi:serine/threonine-protein kinase RsbT